MPNNEEMDDNTEITLTPVPATISFERKNDLIRVSKRCAKAVDKALAFLETVVADPEAEIKQRIDSAKFIVTMTKEISESISKDQLSRSIAQSRLALASLATQQKHIKDVGNSDDEEYSQPQYLPSVILNNENIRSM